MGCKLCKWLSRTAGIDDLNRKIIDQLKVRGYRRVVEELVNRKIFEELLEEKGQLPPPEEVELAYSIIQFERKNKNISDVAHNELMKFLSRYNLSYGKLKQEMISHTTLRKHVVECLGYSSHHPKKRIEEYFVKRKAGIEYGVKIILREVERLKQKKILPDTFQVEIYAVCQKCRKELPLPDLDMKALQCNCIESSEARSTENLS
jgi:hypothetical protein